MTRSIIRLSGVLAVLLIALLANLTFIQVFKADEYRTATGNSRAILEEYSRERGPILVGREAVAESVETDGELKYLRQYPQGELYAPATGLLLAGLRIHRHREGREQGVVRRRRPVAVRPAAATVRGS